MSSNPPPRGPWDPPPPLSQPPSPQGREPIFNPNAFEAWPVIMLVASFAVIHAVAIYGGQMVEIAFLREYAFFSSRFWAGRDLSATVSYAFLHGGWLHLGMNSVACFALGTMCWRYMGSARFFLFFALTAAAGAAAFAVVRPEAGPLVGASGAIFGMLGAIKRIEFRLQHNRGIDTRRPVLVFLFQIVALNIAIGVATFGQMAWEAHLGGMALGWIIIPWMIGNQERG